MTVVPDGIFPAVEDVTTLWRSLVNDTFPGLQGKQGRIATDDAAFTLPFLNSAFRRLQRQLRIEGVTFPIIDGFVILGLPPVVKPDPSIFVSVGFDGYNNGTQNYGALKLPSNCMQVEVVRQRTSGSNLQFVPMLQSMEGLESGYQNNWLGQWEWRGYAIFMNGSLQAQDIMLRYKSGQPPINAPSASFANTTIQIADSTDALANMMAYMYGQARGANPELVKMVKADADEAIANMAEEWVRRQQTVTYSRISYKDGGSDNYGNTTLGTSGTVG